MEILTVWRLAQTIAVISAITSTQSLAANVGLSIQTMWNWDFKNPNAETASKLRMSFLSTQPSLTLFDAYSGADAPGRIRR
jgi:hypothetical protein